MGRTHRGEGVEGGRGEWVTVSSAHHETFHVKFSRALERFTERNPWFLPSQGLRTGREQHVPEFSNHSLYLMKLLSSIFILRDTAEGNCTHNTHMRTNTHSPTHRPFPSPPSRLPHAYAYANAHVHARVFLYVCACVCACMCMFMCMYKCIV